jgi:hypothetical protein
MVVDPRLAPLLGTWRGSGEGTLPGMGAFPYEEELRLEEVGPSVAYFQRAWDPATGQVLHAEVGIWRLGEGGTLVAAIAQARRTEVAEGTVTAGRVDLASTATAAASGGMPVTATRRWYAVRGDELAYEFAMATGDMPEPVRHLAGTLRRAGA